MKNVFINVKNLIKFRDTQYSSLYYQNQSIRIIYRSFYIGTKLLYYTKILMKNYLQLYK